MLGYNFNMQFQLKSYSLKNFSFLIDNLKVIHERSDMMLLFILKCELKSFQGKSIHSI